MLMRCDKNQCDLKLLFKLRLHLNKHHDHVNEYVWSLHFKSQAQIPQSTLIPKILFITIYSFQIFGICFAILDADGMVRDAFSKPSSAYLIILSPKWWEARLILSINV